MNQVQTVFDRNDFQKEIHLCLFCSKSLVSTILSYDKYTLTLSIQLTYETNERQYPVLSQRYHKLIYKGLLCRKTIMHFPL